MALYTKSIRYDKETRDYDVYVSIDGDEPQYIGSAGHRLTAETMAHDYAMAYFEYTHTPEKVAKLVMEAA